jgi:hypothetical protein
VLGTAITLLGSLAKEWLGGKVAVTKAKAEAKVAIEQKRAESEATWEIVQAEASKGSWKDEAWTLVLIAPLVSVFVPGLQAYVAEGFTVLEDTVPDWYMLLVMTAVGAAFGVRGLASAVKGWGKK